MGLTFHQMDETSARTIQSWRYKPPYAIYNPGSDDVENDIQRFMDPGSPYYGMADEQGELVAYCCFGMEAQVPGGDYRSEALDIGLGVRPDLTGQGQGLAYVNGVLDFARATFAPCSYRVTIAEFNERARRVWEKAEFQFVARFQRERDGRSFVVLAREV